MLFRISHNRIVSKIYLSRPELFICAKERNLINFMGGASLFVDKWNTVAAFLSPTAMGRDEYKYLHQSFYYAIDILFYEE